MAPGFLTLWGVLKKHQHSQILYLELGVGGNTPVIIKYPFWNYVHQNKKAIYASINLNEVYCPQNIQKQSLLIQADIHDTMKHLWEEMR